MEDDQNYNYASTELLLESTSKPSAVLKEEDLEFCKSDLILIDSVRNVIDEESQDEVSIVKDLFGKPDTDHSLSDILHEEDLLSKSAISLDVECPQLSGKKSSEVSNLETEDIESDSNSTDECRKSVLPNFNLFSYDTSDRSLCNAFQSDYSENSMTYRKPASDLFNMSVAEPQTPCRTMSENICFESYPGAIQSPMYGQNAVQNAESHDSKVKREILDHSDRRYTGVLKFYNENKGFGFVGCEQDSTEIFLHGDDLLKANIDIKNLKKRSVGGLMRFSFSILEYMGKYNRSRKIVDLKLIEYA